MYGLHFPSDLWLTLIWRDGWNGWTDRQTDSHILFTLPLPWATGEIIWNPLVLFSGPHQITKSGGAHHTVWVLAPPPLPALGLRGKWSLSCM